MPKTRFITHANMVDALFSNAIANIDQTREELVYFDDSSNPDVPYVREMLYQLKSVLMEMDQYFTGGYLSGEYIKEKCDSITRQAEGLHKIAF